MEQTKTILKKTWVVAALACVCCLLWGSAIPLIKTGYRLMQAGVVCGYDSTTESAVTKLMFLLGHDLTPQEIRNEMSRSLAGEITRPEMPTR